MRRGNPNIQLLLPEEEPMRSQTARALAEFFVTHTQRQRDEAGGERGGMLITQVNGVNVAEHPLARFLLDAGFTPAPMGFNVRRNLPQLPSTAAQGGFPGA
jgi:ATP-dependent Lhr-like helicase